MCATTRACAVGGIQYIHVLFLRFNVCIFTDIVKHGVFILVGEIWRYRNDRYYQDYAVTIHTRG